MGNTCTRPKSVTTTWDDAQLTGPNPVSVTSVHIQNLKPVFNKIKDPLESDNEHWVRSNTEAQALIRYFQCNIPSNSYSQINQFFRAFHLAYYNHGEVMLSPDDVWLCVMMNFSKHVTDNAEELRHFFVQHEEKKQLTVHLIQEDWPLFLKHVTDMISRNTKDDVIDLLTCNFSTTGAVERQISQIGAMDTFQKYFDYGMELGCGIGKVHFMGVESDWHELLAKVKALRPYYTLETEYKWTSYVTGLDVIVNKFISTLQGNDEKKWWNQIIDEQVDKGYGMNPDKLSGWITHFWPVHKSFRKIIDVPVTNFSVPVKMMSDGNPAGIMVNVNAGFSGVAVKRNIYRPQLSLCIMEKPIKRTKGDNILKKVRFATRS